jgi:hypothetical protein
MRQRAEERAGALSRDVASLRTARAELAKRLRDDAVKFR